MSVSLAFNASQSFSLRDVASVTMNWFSDAGTRRPMASLTLRISSAVRPRNRTGFVVSSECSAVRNALSSSMRKRSAVAPKM
jgi:hypothetical protein